MIAWARWFVTPPTLEDGDQTRSARVLHACLLVSLAVDVLAEAATFAVSPANGLAGLPWYAVVIAISSAGVIALKRGWRRTVGGVYLGSSFLVVNAAAFVHGGFGGTVMPINLVLIAIAGLVFGVRGALFGAAAATLAGVAVAVGEPLGWVGARDPAANTLIPYLLTVGIMGGLLVIADSALRQALAAAQAARDEARRTARELEQTSHVLDDVIRSMADALALVDAAGRIARTNPALDELVGRRDLVGTPISALFGPSDAPDETALLDVDGVAIDVAASRGEIVDPTGARGAAVWVFRDIRHRKEAERRLRESAEAAEAANRAKSQFLANMSHELRTPLNAIIGYAEMVREDTHDPQVSADLAKIEDSGRHLLTLINDILDLSKIEAGKMELHQEDFSVADACRDALGMIEPLATKNGNALVLEVGEDVGRMRSDVVRVRQVLYNLLSNAAKFTHQGRITLRASRVGAELRFEVADTGIGIPPEVQERLFRPFSQADASTTRRYGGTGLGLALVRHFAAILGGEVSLTSESGRGSTFVVRLPETLAGAGVAVAPLPAADGAFVLAIDDDPKVHEILSRTLARRGIRVVSAMSGAEGVSLARQLRPRAITLDVMMPGMDGWEVLAALKADPGTRDIPVAMLTIVDGELRGRQLGAAAWLLKPVDRRRLVDVLSGLIGLPAEVLVVDDDPMLRELAVRLLVEQGCTVRSASNGKEALAELLERAPQLVMLDLMMPEMDGFQLLDAVRGIPELAAVPFVVLTAADLNPDDRARLGPELPVLTKGGDPAAQILAALVGATPVPAPTAAPPAG